MAGKLHCMLLVPADTKRPMRSASAARTQVHRAKIIYPGASGRTNNLLGV
jgi:hypothetical protein